MQLHQLPSLNNKSKKRVGRGGKRGTTSGRGQKGQKSRAGRRIRPASRDLILHLPKRRGFRNKPFPRDIVILNLRDLIAAVKAVSGREGAVLDKTALKALGFLSAGFKGEVKILGGGEISSPVTVKRLLVSKSARMKIEKAGGTIADQRGLNADNRRKLPRKSA